MRIAPFIPSLLIGASTLLLGHVALAATLTVGPGKTYAAPCNAIAAAQVGDVIEVDASGTYAGDHCAWSTDNLTVRGVGGRAKIDAGGNLSNIAQGKGIFVISAPNATIENFELAGAVADPGSKNGAGIRHQGTNLIVRGCYFHDDEDGILGGPAVDGTGEVLIEKSEFAKNGQGDGFSHNMYLNHYAKFTLRDSYSHGAKVGHLVKSRAAENHVEYNRITDEPGTTASYEIDLPNAGLSYVIGNLIEQSPESQNPNIVAYGEESAGLNPDHRLFFVNNTVVNHLASGTFLAVATPEAVIVTNNIFVGPGTVCSQAGAILKTNFTTDPLLVNAAGFDFHLQMASACIDTGSDPGLGAGQALTPTRDYVHPTASEIRATVGGKIDIGAYEYGNTGVPPIDDGGAPKNDSGLPVGDGGGSAANDGGAGAGAAPGDSAGCGCRQTPGGTSSAWLVGAGAFLIALRRRRR
jgi:MYXO-CTERM domain-containing protein